MKHLLLSRSILDQPYIYDVMQHHIKKDDRVLVILYSFFDAWFSTEAQYQAYYHKDSEYVQKMQRQFSIYGVTDVSFLNYFSDDADTRLQKIKHATILYFPGGAPDQMMRRFDQHHLVKPLKQFQGLTIGSSAGAMIHLKKPHLYKDDDYHKFQYIQGLGYVDGFDISVHYRRRNQQDKAIRRVVSEKAIDIYAIPDDGGLFIDDQHIQLLGSASKIMNHKGKFL